MNVNIHKRKIAWIIYKLKVFNLQRFREQTKEIKSFFSSGFSFWLNKAFKISQSAPIVNNEYIQIYPYPSSLPDISVVKQYSDSALDKKNIVNNFSYKSVIYMWFNFVKNEVYITLL